MRVDDINPVYDLGPSAATVTGGLSLNAGTGSGSIQISSAGFKFESALTNAKFGPPIPILPDSVLLYGTIEEASGSGFTGGDTGRWLELTLRNTTGPGQSRAALMCIGLSGRGNVTTTPLPAAVWLGVALFAGLGVARKMRS